MEFFFEVYKGVIREGVCLGKLKLLLLLLLVVSCSFFFSFY